MDAVYIEEGGCRAMTKTLIILTIITIILMATGVVVIEYRDRKWEEYSTAYIETFENLEPVAGYGYDSKDHLKPFWR